MQLQTATPALTSLAGRKFISNFLLKTGMSARLYQIEQRVCKLRNRHLKICDFFCNIIENCCFANIRQQARQGHSVLSCYFKQRASDRPMDPHKSWDLVQSIFSDPFRALSAGQHGLHLDFIDEHC